jgi:chaperonin GroES
MNVTPLFDRVIIKPDPDKEKKIGSIIIPGLKRSGINVMEGTVISVGDGTQLDGTKYEMRLKAGDRVVINKFSGAEIETTEGTYVLMREYEVFGKVNE